MHGSRVREPTTGNASSQAILCIHKSFGAEGLLARFIQYLLQGLFAQTIHNSSMSVLRHQCRSTYTYPG